MPPPAAQRLLETKYLISLNLWQVRRWRVGSRWNNPRN